MGDLKTGETFQDSCYIFTTATGVAAPGLAPTCFMVKIADNTRTALTVQEVGSGWYRVTDFTNDAAGGWATEWAVAGAYTLVGKEKTWKVSGGDITTILADTNALETRLTAVRAGYIDELAPANMPTDLSNIETKVDTAVTNTGTTEAKVDTAIVDIGTVDTALAVVDAFHDVPAEDVADDVVMSDVVGKKSDTVAGTSIIAITKQNKAALVVVDGLHDVPVEDAAGDTTIRDVVGKKSDTVAGDSLVALVKIETAALAVVDTNVDDIETRVENTLHTTTYFSNLQEEVAITAGAGDKSLPDVTLPNISGTIVHVYAGFKFRMIENTNAGANKLSGVQEIQVRTDAPGAWADAINFLDDQYSIAATTREGGDCVIGSIDLVGTVAAFNDTYNFQWDEAVADLANINFNDVQTFLIVRYY